LLDKGIELGLLWRTLEPAGRVASFFSLRYMHSWRPDDKIELMIFLRVAYVSCSLGTALAAFVAAEYWYLSSRPTPKMTVPPIASISDNPELHVLGAQVDIMGIRSALCEASQLNKKAAIWSGIAALLGGVSAVLGFL
jgi:hypothetical protein